MVRRINHDSFDLLNIIIVGFSTIVAIGGDASKRRVSGAGAMFGGVLYAILLALINFSLQTEYSKIKDVAIPTLNLAKGIHPWLGLVLTVIMLAVMYNTILGLCYSLQRVSQNLIVKIPYIHYYHDGDGIYFKFRRFADLINVLYKFMGIVGLFIVVAVLIKYYKRKKMMKSISRNHCFTLL